MIEKMIFEFIGTMILILMGDGLVWKKPSLKVPAGWL